jgi:polyphosphate kinase 2
MKKNLITEIHNMKKMMGTEEQPINEGFFNNLISSIFGKEKETDAVRERYITEIRQFLQNEGLLSNEVSNLLDDISFANNADLLNYETFSRTISNVLFKKGDKEENLKKYLNKVLRSLSKREGFEELLPSEKEIDPEGEESVIGRKQFLKELRALQIELLKMQEWLKGQNSSVVILFEGRDTAGKGSTISKFTEYLDPKYYKVVVKDIPTEEERQNWFTRYAKDIEPGKIIFFDRSWYNRGIVEPVMGYSSEEEYEFFMKHVNSFEKWLTTHDYLIKFWLSITKETQQKRFDIRQSSPLKYWKFSPNDAKAQEMWDEYTKYKEKVFDLTSTEYAPWTVVDSNDKRISGLNAIRYVLKTVPYEGKDNGNIGGVFPEVVTTIK